MIKLTPTFTSFVEQEVSRSMKKRTIKFLTIFLLLVLTQEVFASILKQEKSQSHMRWNVFVDKDNLVVKKTGAQVLIQTLDRDTLEKIEADLSKLVLDKKYITSYKVTGPSKTNNVRSIKIELSSSNVEIFTFYRDREKNYIVDFWVDSAGLTDNDTAISKLGNKQKKSKSIKSKTIAKPVKINVVKRIKPLKKTSSKKVVKYYQADKKVRDFRYGASFVWDYPAMSPKLKSIINLERKTPEFFYPLANRDVEKSEIEAHLQLNMNLFKKRKYGLMYKSIQLFEKKFGDDLGYEVNEYLKANAILRDNFRKGNIEPVKTAVAMLSNLAQKSTIYDQRKGIRKYLITYSMNRNENIKSLEIAKEFYVDSKENFDYEESNWAAEAILNNLARLKQVDKVEELLKDKIIIKFLPKQVMVAYEMYILLKLGKVDDVIKVYNASKRSLAKPVHEVILYNLAEAYFRNGKYKKAAKVYDEFISQYSFNTYSSHARLRLALCYELLEKDYKETEVLYRNAINRSLNKEISYEARVRYVGLRTIRKRKLTEEDIETRVFLDRKEKFKLSSDLNRLRWLIRLRTLVVDKEYMKALSYLNALPMQSMTPSLRRVYEADGAEIVYGLISDLFEKGEYAKVIQAWEVYKNKYISKVALDGNMNFLVGQSFIKLGLYDGFDKLYTEFSKTNKSVQKTFPIWYDRKIDSNTGQLLAELQVIRNIKLKNLERAKKDVKKLSKLNPKFSKNKYYLGKILYMQKDYKGAVQNYESFMAQKSERNLKNDREVADLLLSYTDSIYKIGDKLKYRRISDAILNDTKKYSPNNKYMKSVRERIAYTNIEVIAAENDDAQSLLLEAKIVALKKEYPKTLYFGRLNYLLGKAFVNNQKLDAGKKILNSLLTDDKVEDHIKEMAKSELALIKIKEKTI